MDRRLTSASEGEKPAHGRLDHEVVELLQDDPELLAVADAVARTHRPQVGASRRRRRLPAALIAAVVAVILIAPAYALVRFAHDFFSSPPASKLVVAQFADLQLSPAKMNPRVIASQARLISTFPLADGSKVELSVAPTRAGGFCEDFSGFAQTCDSDRSNPFDVGLAAKQLPSGLAVVFGDVLDSNVALIELRMRDGKTIRVPVVRVSAPIDAAFFMREFSVANQPTEARALDAHGNELARRTIALRFPTP